MKTKIKSDLYISFLAVLVIELFTGLSLFLMSMENNKIIHRLKAGVTIIIEV